MQLGKSFYRQSVSTVPAVLPDISLAVRIKVFIKRSFEEAVNMDCLIPGDIIPDPVELPFINNDY